LTRYHPQPPWEFLLTASRNSLQSYELTRLSHAANLRKEISALMDQWLEENSSAAVARWLIAQRERPGEPADASATGYPGADGHRGNTMNASDNFFAEAALGPPSKNEIV
jgi:hypothetical protein